MKCVIVVTVTMTLWAWLAVAVPAWQSPPAKYPPLVSGLLFSPDHKLLLVGYVHITGKRGEERRTWNELLDTRSGKLLQRLPGNEIGLWGNAAFGPDHLIAVFGTGGPGPFADDIGPILWDSATGKKRVRLPDARDAPICSIAVSADGKRALTTYNTDQLKLWDLSSGRLLRTLGVMRPLEPFMVVSIGVKFLNGDRWALADFRDGPALWELTGERLLCTYREYSFPCALSPTGKLALSRAWSGRASERAHLLVWELATGQQVSKLRVRGSGILACTFTADGKGLFSIDSDGNLTQWNLASGKACWSVQTGSRSAATKVAAFSPNGKRAVTVDAVDDFRLWDTETAKVLRLLRKGGRGNTGAVRAP
jgi:WD40 repeat protein